MQKTSKLLWSCIAGIAAIVCVCNTNALAAGRSMLAAGDRVATANVNASAALKRTQLGTNSRMPTMPTMSINTVGTHAASGVDNTDTDTDTSSDTGTTTDPVGPSDYCDGQFTVDMCMEELTACVQNGGLANGLSTLFSEDLRHSIFNGMGICSTELDKCVHEARNRDCELAYTRAIDVWIDFNSRVIQPAYYNFVLRKTGLTPNQAENVCALLDKNVYGKSFAAVSDSDLVTEEFAHPVGAYNEQLGGILSKDRPQGSIVNTTENGNHGFDGERGHYARWDATNAVCKIRVAAYNKNDLITNKWLFGTFGNDMPAEVWQDAGSTFTCNKDLFDFSLLTTTRDVALVGLPGGALLGAGTGALVGQKSKAFDPSDADMCQKLFDQIKKYGSATNTEGLQINQFLENKINPSAGKMSAASCKEVYNLYKKFLRLQVAVADCPPEDKNTAVFHDYFDINGKSTECRIECKDFAANRPPKITGENCDKMTTEVKNEFISNAKERCHCSFKPLAKPDPEIYCNEGEFGCNPREQAAKEVELASGVFAKIDVLKQGQESKVLQSTLVGAGIGLGAGGLATAITSFVERNNVTCHVGDGLNKVAYGKSLTIDSLKDFYVKWNLRVADSVRPTARVTNCTEWRETCGMYMNENDCNNVEIYYQRPGTNTTTLIRNACAMNSEGVCQENTPVAVSYGVCPRPQGDDNQSGGGQGSTSIIEH